MCVCVCVCVRVCIQELQPLVEIQPMSVHVGNPFAGEGTSEDTSVSAQLLAVAAP